MRRRFLHRLEDVGEIGIAVAAAHRRSDGEKHELGLAHRLSQRRGKMETSRFRVARDQRVEAGLVDRHLASLEPGDPTRVLVDARYGEAEFGKTGRRDQSHIACANDADLHGTPPPERTTQGPWFTVCSYFPQVS